MNDYACLMHTSSSKIKRLYTDCIVFLYTEVCGSFSVQFIEELLNNNHGSIKEAFISDLTLASNKLFTYHFIHAHTLRNVTMGSTPASSMAHRLTWECQMYITLHPDPEGELNVMLDILEDVQPLGPIVATSIREVKIPFCHQDCLL